MQAVTDIIKKNLLSIIFALIAILAIGALYWPLGGKFEDLRTRLHAKKSEYDALDALQKKQPERKFPQTDASQTEAPRLGVFPTEDIIQKASKIKEDIASQAKAVSEHAAKLNEHTLIMPGSLPNGGQLHLTTYAQEYAKRMDYANPDKAVRSQTMPAKILGAGVPPTQGDIDAESKRREEDIKNNGIPGINDALTKAKIQQMQATIAEDMRREVASSSQVYMEPEALDVYPGLIARDVTGTGSPPPPSPPPAGAQNSPAATIFFSQIGYWVQEDVFSALAAANKGAGGVMNAPIKQIVKIDVTETAAGGGGSSSGGSQGQQPIEPQTSSATLTGRLSNEQYEVIPFRLVLYVDAAKIPQVLTELSRDRFITVLKCDMTTIDLGTQLSKGYYYGNAPVVQLTLDCEELFLKSWLSKYIPPALAGSATPAAQ